MCYCACRATVKNYRKPDAGSHLDASCDDQQVQQQKIIENLTLAIFLVNEQLCLTYLNPAAEELLSTGRKNALYHPLTDFMRDIDGEFISHVQQSVRTGHPVTEREVCVQLSGGKEITINCSITPMSAKGEKVECLLEVARVDRLLRIAREEHLLSEAQATQNMLRGLAHEIKNPLGGLRGAAQLLASELAEPGLREYTDVIISEADRLRKLIDRMFGPKVVPIKQELNIHDVLEHIRYLASVEASGGITLSTDYDPSIPLIRADRDLLVQAVLNIVRNAACAAQPNGEVTLKTRVLHQFTLGDICHRLVLQVSIVDDGPGIKEELKSQIFFPLVSGTAQGTGLGLPIAQHLINLHGGLIEFDSRPGLTEFCVLLPLHGADDFNGIKSGL